MNYHLSFLDDAGRVQKVCDANFENENAAICWMWIAGGVWVLGYDWSFMELSHQGRTVARVPAGTVRQTWRMKWHCAQDP
jgi:hypothetical protein